MIFLIKLQWYFTLHSLLCEAFKLVPNLPFPYHVLKLFPCYLPFHIIFVSNLDFSSSVRYLEVKGVSRMSVSIKFSTYQVKTIFKHFRSPHKANLTCRKRHNSPPPPGIEVLDFSFFRFILDYTCQNNHFNTKHRTLRRFAKQRAISDLSTFFMRPVYMIFC